MHAPAATCANMMIRIVGNRNSEGMSATAMIAVMSAPRPTLRQRSAGVVPSRLRAKRGRSRRQSVRTNTSKAVRASLSPVASQPDAAAPACDSVAGSSPTEPRAAEPPSWSARAEVTRRPNMSSTATAHESGTVIADETPAPKRPSAKPHTPACTEWLWTGTISRSSGCTQWTVRALRHAARLTHHGLQDVGHVAQLKLGRPFVDVHPNDEDEERNCARQARRQQHACRGGRRAPSEMGDTSTPTGMSCRRYRRASRPLRPRVRAPNRGAGCEGLR